MYQFYAQILGGYMDGFMLDNLALSTTSRRQ